MGKRVTRKLTDFAGTGDPVAKGFHAQLINVRNLSLRFIDIHDGVSTVFDAFEILNPVTADRPSQMPFRSLHCVAVTRPPGIKIVTGFHDYRRIPKDGDVRCFAEPPEADDDESLNILAWDYVFATTPWRALSNKVLSQFYQQYANHVPASVLQAHLPKSRSNRASSELSPSSMELLCGISRKTLHRHQKPSSGRVIKHLPQDKLPAATLKGDNR